MIYWFLSERYTNVNAVVVCFYDSQCDNFNIMKLILLTFSILLITSCANREEQENYCKNQWKILYSFDSTISLENVKCETPYEKCLYDLRNTFSDLSDTWGNNNNNQDSISKTMSAEIDRCIKNITPIIK